MLVRLSCAFCSASESSFFLVFAQDQEGLQIEKEKIEEETTVVRVQWKDFEESTTDGEEENPMETALKMQAAASEVIVAVMDNLERMDYAKRQRLWQVLAELKKYL